MDALFQMGELVNILEEHLPPYIIEEIRGQMLDLIQ